MIGKFALILYVCSLDFANGAALIKPQNVTVEFLSPVSVRASWTMSMKDVEKYDIMYKKTDASYKVVAAVAANSNSVILHNLMANTQYELFITAIKGGKKYRSSAVVFHTSDSSAPTDITFDPVDTVITSDKSHVITGGTNQQLPPYGIPNTKLIPVKYQIRGVEVCIISFVMLLWVAAILLFFRRWGKIRMLLPYQPDYKETQLPGTGALVSSQSFRGTNTAAGSAFCCHQRYTHRRCNYLECKFARRPFNAPYKMYRSQSLPSVQRDDSDDYPRLRGSKEGRRSVSLNRECAGRKSGGPLPMLVLEGNSSFLNALRATVPLANITSGSIAPYGTSNKFVRNRPKPPLVRGYAVSRRESTFVGRGNYDYPTFRNYVGNAAGGVAGDGANVSLLQCRAAARIQSVRRPRPPPLGRNPRARSSTFARRSRCRSTSGPTRIAEAYV